MPSLAWLVVVGGVLLVDEARSAALPVVTPAPSVEDVAMLAKRQAPDAISLAQVLLTAVPASLRQIAATNIPAVSSILFDQFLDGDRPEWFEELPDDIQAYLIRQFGPQTAWPTDAPATTDVDASTTAYPTESWAPVQSSFGWPSPSGTSEDASQAASATDSSGSIQPTRSSASSDSTTLVTSASSESTTLATSASRSSVHSSATPSHSHALSSSLNLSKPSSTPSSTPEPDAPPASNSGLTRKQKIGLGVGIPFAILGAAAFAFGCCTLLRRRKKKHEAGSIPPSSPGFIPRFAFHERSTDNLEHRTSLIQAANQSTHDLRGGAWEDDGIDPMETAPTNNSYALNNPYTMSTPYTMNDVGATSYSNTRPSMADPAPIHHPPSTGMSMHDASPIMAPALFHTHSSNRARGMRTSYTSLQSVTEVTEPDELEPPVLGRDATKHNHPPVIPAAAQIKRKPIPASPPLAPVAQSPAAQEASHKLRRQTMPEHSGSSSSGLALSTSTGKNTSTSSGLAAYPDTESPISPISNHNNRPSYPFNYDTYVEDYGPEYHNGYVDVDDGLYGGNTSLSRYPEAPRRRSSKTEWPLRNMVGSHHRRKSSPLWNRISEE